MITNYVRLIDMTKGTRIYRHNSCPSIFDISVVCPSLSVDTLNFSISHMIGTSEPVAVWWLVIYDFSVSDMVVIWCFLSWLWLQSVNIYIVQIRRLQAAVHQNVLLPTHWRVWCQWCLTQDAVSAVRCRSSDDMPKLMWQAKYHENVSRKTQFLNVSIFNSNFVFVLIIIHISKYHQFKNWVFSWYFEIVIFSWYFVCSINVGMSSQGDTYRSLSGSHCYVMG
jgi:hypothetical protein